MTRENPGNPGEPVATEGVFVPVVGPSGVGKDSLINYARERLSDRPEFVFVRRIITRRADRSSEDHDSVDDAEFDRLVREDQFSLWWEAHGLRYGLPRQIEADLAGGRTVVANVSRQTLPQIRAHFARVCVISVSAQPEIIAARLAARGREDAGAIGARRSRIVIDHLSGTDSINIDNTGPLQLGGDRLVKVLCDASRPQRRETAGARQQAPAGLPENG
jgi:ribose 1,5-bisphosphokinase